MLHCLDNRVIDGIFAIAQNTRYNQPVHATTTVAHDLSLLDVGLLRAYFDVSHDMI